MKSSLAGEKKRAAVAGLSARFHFRMIDTAPARRCSRRQDPDSPQANSRRPIPAGQFPHANCRRPQPARQFPRQYAPQAVSACRGSSHMPHIHTLTLGNKGTAGGTNSACRHFHSWKEVFRLLLPCSANQPICRPADLFRTCNPSSCRRAARDLAGDVPVSGRTYGPRSRPAPRQRSCSNCTAYPPPGAIGIVNVSAAVTVRSSRM